MRTARAIGYLRSISLLAALVFIAAGTVLKKRGVDDRRRGAAWGQLHRCDERFMRSPT